jgi:preprotein translocase subunit SecG
MLYILLLIIHVIACIVLVAVILLQAGRGGGLSEMFGGGEAAQSILGTQAPVVLKKATTISAIAFLCTSLLLGIITARRGRSLFQQQRLPVMPKKTTAPVSPMAMPEEKVAPVSEQQPPAEESQAPTDI